MNTKHIIIVGAILIISIFVYLKHFQIKPEEGVYVLEGQGLITIKGNKLTIVTPTKTQETVILKTNRKFNKVPVFSYSFNGSSEKYFITQNNTLTMLWNGNNVLTADKILNKKD